MSFMCLSLPPIHFSFNCGVGEDSRESLGLQGHQTSQSYSPEYSLEGLMLKPKLQYRGQLMQRTGSLEKTLMLGKIEGRRRRGMTEDEMVGWHHAKCFGFAGSMSIIVAAVLL